MVELNKALKATYIVERMWKHRTTVKELRDRLRALRCASNISIHPPGTNNAEKWTQWIGKVRNLQMRIKSQLHGRQRLEMRKQIS